MLHRTANADQVKLVRVRAPCLPLNAGMGKLVKSPDLGSGVFTVRVRVPVQYSRGEIGRRAGLKILSFGVWVQVPPGVQKKNENKFGSYKNMFYL